MRNCAQERNQWHFSRNLSSEKHFETFVFLGHVLGPVIMEYGFSRKYLCPPGPSEDHSAAVSPGGASASVLGRTLVLVLRILDQRVSGSTCIQALPGRGAGGGSCENADSNSVMLGQSLGLCILTNPQVVPTLQTRSLRSGQGHLDHCASPHLRPPLFIFPTFQSQCQHMPAYTLRML